jgi:hypothetical protein
MPRRMNWCTTASQICTGQSMTSILLILGAGTVLLGLLLIRQGYRPQRLGSAPYCAKCDYIVGGLDAPRCPECGADLSTPSAIVEGERTIRPVRGRTGIGVAIVGMGALALPLFSEVRSIEWYHHKPTAWVIEDYNSSGWERSAKAWRELQRRGGISPPSRRPTSSGSTTPSFASSKPIPAPFRRRRSNT